MAEQSAANMVRNEAYICFTAEINDDSIEELMTEVNRVQSQGTKRIVLLISSPGGNPKSAVKAYNFLKSFSDLEIVTHNIGRVASATVPLYCAGSVRLSAPYAYFLLHEVYYDWTRIVVTQETGAAELVPVTLTQIDFEQRYSNLVIDRAESAKIIASVTGKQQQEVERDMIVTTVLNADHATAYGKNGLVHRADAVMFMELGQEVNLYYGLGLNHLMKSDRKGGLTMVNKDAIAYLTLERPVDEQVS